ncbi:MAG: 4Fe-4S dicluster domain-containing protein, partial [Mucispirillum sp.]|nr:4Fe-4S dicluster domain-containing protein [Mucispirillum sp.]
VKQVTSVLVAGEGDKIKVSEMPADGTWPTGTARFEKRNIAVNIPEWDSETCIQCGICSFVCPHSAIRMKVYDKELLKDAPASFKYADAKGKEFDGYAATIQVAPEDCTGCSACVANCPAVSKKNPELKAINMAPQIPLRDQEVHNFNFFLNLPELPIEKYNKATIKGSQLAPHGFEFSGACAGCGETPYVKLLTQLFGDRLLMANATGCSSIYGGNLPTTPYCTRKDGRGPAWSNSLFEDNAEFGYGMRMAVNYFSGKACEYLNKYRGELGYSFVDEILASINSHDQAEIEKQRVRVEELKNKIKASGISEKDDFISIADYLVPKSVWILGGDGWAYDIG